MKIAVKRCGAGRAGGRARGLQQNGRFKIGQVTECQGGAERAAATRCPVETIPCHVLKSCQRIAALEKAPTMISRREAVPNHLPGENLLGAIGVGGAKPGSR